MFIFQYPHDANIPLAYTREINYFIFHVEGYSNFLGEEGCFDKGIQ